MSTLTVDVSRLCLQIKALRGARKELLKNLARGAVSRREAIIGMRAAIDDARLRRYWEAKAGRDAILSGIKKTVFNMRKAFGDDISGARRAWRGPAPGERTTWDRQTLMGAEAEAKARAEEAARTEAARGAEARAAARRKAAEERAAAARTRALAEREESEQRQKSTQERELEARRKRRRAGI